MSRIDNWGTAQPAAGEPSGGVERSSYFTGGLRQTALALLLLLALPFTFGVIDMLLRRMADGLWIDVSGLAVIAAGLLIATAMLALELLFALRARLHFGKAALTFTLPRNGGPLPLLRYTKQDIPYHAIKSIELRREVFGGRLAPVLLRGLVVRTKDGRELVLGHTLEGFADPAFPFAEIGEKLANRCALPLLDQRTIWRRSRKDRALGYISEYDTNSYILDPADTERLNGAHRRLVLGLASGLAALVMIGALADLSA